MPRKNLDQLCVCRYWWLTSPRKLRCPLTCCWRSALQRMQQEWWNEQTAALPAFQKVGQVILDYLIWFIDVCSLLIANIAEDTWKMLGVVPGDCGGLRRPQGAKVSPEACHVAILIRTVSRRTKEKWGKKKTKSVAVEPGRKLNSRLGLWFLAAGWLTSLCRRRPGSKLRRAIAIILLHRWPILTGHETQTEEIGLGLPGFAGCRL